MADIVRYGHPALIPPCRTLKWPDVVAFYAELAQDPAWRFAPMLALVQFLASSRYATALFPRTSHDLLRIGRVADFNPGDGELQIKFDGPTQRFRFTYIQRPDDHDP